MIENRELNSIEQATEILNRYAGTFNVVTVMRLTGPINEKIVRQALDLVQRRHPRLNSRIVEAWGSMRFETEGTQQIPLRIVKGVYNQAWQNVVSSELNETIDSSKFLMRAVLIPPESAEGESYLITTIHHAIVDGLSSIRMHQDLLTYMQKIASGEQITQVDSLSPLPPIEKLVPESMQGWTGQVKGVSYLLRWMFQYLGNIPETLGFEKCVPIELRRCGWVTRQLDKELTGELRNRCRQEKATVQGALCAALMLATARKITLGNRKDVRVSCNSAVDLRRRLSPVVSHEEMGAVASIVTTWHTIGSNTSFWELARDVRQQLNASINGDDIYTMVLMSGKTIESYVAWPNLAFVTGGISYVGDVTIPRVYGQFKLEEMSLMAGMAAYGGLIGAIVTKFEGKMIFNFTYSEPSISRDIVETIADEMLYYLARESGIYSEGIPE